MDNEKDEVIALPVEWQFGDIKTRYASNIVVQHGSQEFYISFFEIKPPILLGTPEENKENILKMGSVKAECVARLVVTPEKFQDFIKAMQDNWKTFSSRNAEEDDESST